MDSPIPDYLDSVLEDVRSTGVDDRAVNLDELSDGDRDAIAAAFATIDGEIYTTGDAEVEFPIQSISKPFTYALALADCGLDAVLDTVEVEPSGEPFNEISVDDDGRPFNPMINAGAIAVHSLIGGTGCSSDDRRDRLLEGISAFAGRRLEVDERVLDAEMGDAHRNLAIAHMLRSYDILHEDPEPVIEGYSRQCALKVTTRDLAVMAATLANNGVNPVTGDRVIPASVIRQVLSVMATCGMYDAAGDWVTQVGIPAKSGVSGGLIGALPGQVGVATYSPPLDQHGNSVRGVDLFGHFSSNLGMHLMEVTPVSRSVIQASSVVDSRTGGEGSLRHIEVQGSVRFAGAERLVREVSGADYTEPAVALDLTAVHNVDAAARRLILQTVERLSADGKDVYLIDPEGVIDDPNPGEGVKLTVVDERGEI